MQFVLGDNSNNSGQLFQGAGRTTPPAWKVRMESGRWEKEKQDKGERPAGGKVGRNAGGIPATKDTKGTKGEGRKTEWKAWYFTPSRDIPSCRASEASDSTGLSRNATRTFSVGDWPLSWVETGLSWVVSLAVGWLSWVVREPVWIVVRIVRPSVRVVAADDDGTREANRHGAWTGMDAGRCCSAFPTEREHAPDTRAPRFDDGHLVEHIGHERVSQAAFPLQHLFLREAVEQRARRQYLDPSGRKRHLDARMQSVVPGAMETRESIANQGLIAGKWKAAPSSTVFRRTIAQHGDKGSDGSQSQTGHPTPLNDGFSHARNNQWQ